MGNKYIWIVVIVFVIVVAFIWQRGPQGGDTDISPSPSASVSPSPSASASNPGTSGQSSGTNYSKLVAQYTAAGTRIQFDSRCQMFPPNLTYKSGTRVMLDNRSKSAVTISLSGQKFIINGLGYRVVTLSSTKLPITLVVDCSGQQNVGTILLQR